jgi:hypothetical protein
MPHRHSLLQNSGESFVQLVDKLTRSVSVQLDGLAFLAGKHSGVPTKRVYPENPVAMYVKVQASGVIYFIVQSLAKWGAILNVRYEGHGKLLWVAKTNFGLVPEQCHPIPS